MQIKCAHKGTFIGRGPRPGRPVYWMVELWRPYPDGEGPEEPADLTFPADSPLEIEWEDWEPETAVQGSMLTLKVQSMTDREFIDYYTTEAAKIYIKVFRRDAVKERDWRLVWRGSLDPEFYEEPYERSEGYDVTLTFSDFGALDRIDFRSFSDYFQDYVTGRVSLSCILGEGLYQARMIDRDDYWIDIEREILSDAKLIDFNGTEYTLADSFNDLTVAFGNFEDEEGKPDTWREVIEAVLMPLGLHIVQRGGKIFIYDTDYVFGNMADDADGACVNWVSDSQTLSTAKTYNNIEVTFSPYSRPRILDDKPDINDGDTIRSDKIVGNWLRNKKYTGQATMNFYRAFRLTRTRTGEGAEFAIGDVPYFRMTPLAGSCTECTGYMFEHDPRYSGVDAWMQSEADTYPDRTLIRLAPVAIPPKTGDGYLLLSMSMLFDPRYNPFEQADTGTEEATNNLEAYETYQKLARWVSVPLRILLRNAAGQVTHYYSNIGEFDRINFGKENVTGGFSLGTWMPYSAQSAGIWGRCCVTQWYADGAEDPALDGWTTNRPTIGIWPSAKDLPLYYTHGPRGMLMAYPPQAGFIEISVMDGLLVHRRGNYKNQGIPNNGDSWPVDEALTFRPPRYAVISNDYNDVVKKCGWWAFKDISLSLVGTDGAYKEVSSDDIVTEGVIDTNVREDLKVETHCGAVRRPAAGMMGLYMFPSGPVWSMKRAGVHSYMERILMGSLYSQYAHRRTVLSGTATENVMNFPVWMDHNTPGLFIIQSSTLDAIEGTEDLKLVRLYPDSYESEPITPLPRNEFIEPEDPRKTEPEFDSGQDNPWDPDDLHDLADPWDPAEQPEPWDDEDPYWDDRFDDYDRYDDY